MSDGKKSGDKEVKMGNVQRDGSAVQGRQIDSNDIGFVESVFSSGDRGREGSIEERGNPVDVCDRNKRGEEIPQVVSTIVGDEVKGSNDRELEESGEREIKAVAGNDEGHVEEEEEEEEDEEEVEHALSKGVTVAARPANITYDEMSRVGKMVKRILDQGRVEYLRTMDLHANQTQYCQSSLSPECVMIIATRR